MSTGKYQRQGGSARPSPMSTTTLGPRIHDPSVFTVTDRRVSHSLTPGLPCIDLVHQSCLLHTDSVSQIKQGTWLFIHLAHQSCLLHTNSVSQIEQVTWLLLKGLCLALRRRVWNELLHLAAGQDSRV